MTKFVSKPKGWICEVCNTFYPEKRMATFCERRHATLQQYRAGNIDELEVAKAWGYDLSTPEKKAKALEIVRNMVADMEIGGVDLQPKVADAPPRPFTGGVGRLLAVTKMHSNGRIQVPIDIRNAMHVRDEQTGQMRPIQDGDPVYWYELNERFFIREAVEDSGWRTGKGHFSPPTS